MNEIELFSAALKLSAADRAKFLDLACKGNPELRGQVEGLLKAHFDSATLPHEPADKPIDRRRIETMAQSRPTETPGTMIGGRYKLIEAIGEGGMGSVWLAEQGEPVKRLVALKLIKAGMDSKLVLARFEVERQALALMDHPNIARIIDGGLTETGAPFFVMELVKGVPITEYCDTRKLTPIQRLELFVPVCQAIQHAHQKGIIHRDIKPNNVLIALYDDRPVPKVIDFGLAKATGQSLTEKSLNTGFNVVGTPQYMSPEQATFNQMDIDTRSDIYSLGVLLYELLAGSPPFKRQDLENAGFLEILRVIREEDPPRPSTKLSTAEGLPGISSCRGTEPKKLTGLLRNELDWIVMKSLEKDRARRYVTANGFAADINRYLAGEAVLAHPPSRVYRLQKFLRKNKGLVLAANLVLLALLAGVVGTSFGLFRANRSAESAKIATKVAENRRAEAEDQKSRAEAGEKLAEYRLALVQAEKKRVEEEKQISQALLDFLQNKLLGQADFTTQANALIKSGGTVSDAKKNPTIRELLDRAAGELTEEKIESSFPHQPLVQAEILNAVGITYKGQGEFELATEFLERSLSIRKRHLGSNDPEFLRSMNSLALAYQKAGKLDLALPLLEETLELMVVQFGQDYEDSVAVMNNLGMVYHDVGQSARALPLLEQAIALKRAKVGNEHPDTLTIVSNIAVVCEATGNVDRAIVFYEEANQLQKALLGADHPDSFALMNNLASAYLKARKPELAIPLFEKSLEFFKKKFGPEHPDTSTIMNNLAEAYRVTGKLNLALPLFEQSLAIDKVKLGPDHPGTLVSMHNLARAYQGAGNLDSALPLLEEVLRQFKAQLGNEHPNTIRSMVSLGDAYLEVGRPDNAIPLYEDVMRFQEISLGRQHAETLRTVAYLGISYKEAGRLNEGMLLLEEAYRASKQVPQLAFTGRALLESYTKAADPTKPEDLARVVSLTNELLAAARDTLPKDSPELAGQLAAASMTLLTFKEWDAAEPLIREALTIREAKEPDDWRTFNTKSMLGGALLGQKKFADAEPLLLAGYEGLKQRETTIPPQGSTRLPEALERLVTLYTDWHAAEPDQGFDAKAAEWQTNLDENKAAATADTPPPADKGKQP